MEFKSDNPTRIEEQVRHATPLSVDEYQGSDICAAEKNYDISTSVSQGSGKLVHTGRLYSEGFSKCTAFVIKNPDTKAGGLFHIADIDFELEHQVLLERFFLEWLNTKELQPEEKKNLSQAITDICYYRYPKTMRREDIAPRLKALGVGQIKTKLFSGSGGRYTTDSRLRESMLSFLGVELPQTYIFDNKKMHWSILVNFDDDSVEVGIKHEDQVLQYTV